MKTLVVSGHTDLKNSVANKTILETLEKELTNAEFDYLDSLYPDYKFDVKKEQGKLVDADVIVLQFPIFWYRTPSLLDKWMEDVFTHGFSHGSEGGALRGKKLVLSLTTGAGEELYQKDGLMGNAIEELLAPFKSICNMTGLIYAGYIYTGGVSYLSRNDENAMKEMKLKSVEHANRVKNLVESL